MSGTTTERRCQAEKCLTHVSPDHSDLDLACQRGELWHLVSILVNVLALNYSEVLVFGILPHHDSKSFHTDCACAVLPEIENYNGNRIRREHNKTWTVAGFSLRIQNN